MLSNDINQKMQLVPELRSPHARYPLNRSHWIKTTQEPRTPKKDGDELTFIARPKPPKGQTNEVKLGYVWGPGPRGFGYYHLLTQASYTALAARLHSETAPSVTCCFGKSKEDNVNLQDLQYVYQIVVYPRSRSPVPKDSYAYEHSVQEGRAAFVPTEDKQWSEVIDPIKQGKVKA
uniref:Uncharacterized protein n=1 Tax=Helicotheca tamesis TaxID=374047 RepID=A0A6U0FT60_9STRA|mmetsp:Transcript_1629/g.2349  ORF Transcript_1629/g.2349 Transcript_1629/m.2349 type:complete len:176 (+) Transcript_1629:288-815(+)|eukprot:CAMPEP_0185726534 /NCGR_PEP_ID=MMETSP1171-20130828/2493_1 /TAXON_ID=374046 /ORGANISM="Helicotheca tamensis, Strain CCMP826" /LENGTH=175 /DNA_ID=CAMNT_0028394913 /DNA_START=207 /DNA_END=734 /DNA_ORIENTATION=+